MPETNKLRVGDKLIFTDDQWELIKDAANQIDNAKGGLDTFSGLLRTKNKMLWKLIRNMKPEVDDFNLTLKKSTKELILTSKK